jgi:hypothetical protein
VTRTVRSSRPLRTVAPRRNAAANAAALLAGEIVAPQCFVAPMLNGPRGSDLPCATPDAARANLAKALALDRQEILARQALATPTPRKH